MQESGNHADHHEAPESEASRSGDPEADAATSVRDELAGVLEDLGRLATLQWEQARLAASTSVRRVLGLSLIWLAAAAATMLCAMSLVRGVAGGLSLWTGQAWLGELLAGLLGLGALALVWELRIRYREARLLQRLKQRFGPVAAVPQGPARMSTPTPPSDPPSGGPAGIRWQAVPNS